MRRLIVTFLIFFLFYAKPFAGGINLDSLEKVLDKTTNPKEQIEILKQLSNENLDTLSKTKRYANRGIALCRKMNSKKDESQFLYDLGYAYSNIDEFEDANKYYKQSLQIRISLNDVPGVADIYFQYAQNFLTPKTYNVDSAESYLKKILAYSEKEEIFEQQGKAYFLLARINIKASKNPEAYKMLENSLKLYIKSDKPEGKARVLTTMGQLNYTMGNNDEAIKLYKEALQIRKSLNDNNACALLNYSIGNVFMAKGSFNEAMVSFQEALGFFDKSGNLTGVANCYNNIGLVYHHFIRNANIVYDKTHYENSKKYHLMALEIRKKLGNESEIANSIINIANISSQYSIDSMRYYYGDNWKDSLTVQTVNKILKQPLAYYEEALEIKKRLEDKEKISICLNMLAKLSNWTGNYGKAQNYIKESLQINKELNDQVGLMQSYYEYATLMKKLKRYDEAKLYFDIGANIADTLGDKYYLKEFYLEKSLLYDELGDCIHSLQFYKKYQKLLDEITSANNYKSIQEMNTKYETAQKEKDLKIKESQIKQQKITIYSTVLVLLLIIGVAVLLVKQNRERKRVNEKLEHQNEVITEQKQEITDSIRYASLIQTAAMPALSVAQKYFSDSFIFFRPRDIVSGDFYWIKDMQDKIIIAVADCTGHGVPGAFMSMLGISNLNNIVSTSGEHHSDDILNELRAMIIKELNQTGRSGENKDGMDMALYIYDPEKKEIEYSGANNPLIIIRNGEILETKANKMPIGIHDRIDESFARHVIPVEPGDMIYTFSDGYADQFGGDDNRKFMSGKMKKMFASIANEPIDVQHKTIEKANLDWRGENYQVDDMLIIGVRI